MPPSAISKLQSAVSQVKQVNVLKTAQLEDSPTIKVCVRVRPFIKEEVEGQRSGGECKLCIDMPSETQVRILNFEDPDDESRAFEFDRCYWSHSSDHQFFATQETLQSELGVTMLEHAMNGFNNCIFAYGQTGSGKSYSVLGGKGEERGLLPRVVEGLFDHFAKLPEGATYKTLVAFMEIYNEQIRDLLAPADSEIKKLEVKQHPVLGTIVPGLTEAAVASGEEVLNLVDYGSQMRHVSATAMNATSSRSHCIFTFKTSLTEPDQPSKVSQTHLVDLAGSERAGRTKATGDRLKEGAAINQSLSTLARVISELAKSAKSKKKPNPPFRESKLTYILKESLCGNSKTVMMAAISPNFLDYDETLSTLKFAQSVKQVQTKAVQNAVNMSSVEAQLRAELNALKSQLQAYQDSVESDELGFLKRRLEEQEQLCAYYGKDWDSLLAEEKSRMDERRTSLHPSALGGLGKLKKMEESLDSDDDIEDDDVESFTCSLLMLGKPVEETPKEGRSSLVAPIRSSLAVVGPMAQQLLAKQDKRAQSELLRRQLDDLSAIATEAEEQLNEFQSDEGMISLKVLVVIDPQDEDCLEAALVVQASAKSSLPSSWTWPRQDTAQEQATADWCSGSELKKRLAWLKEHRSSLGSKTAPEAWLAAGQAISGHEQLQALQRENAEMAKKLAEMQARLSKADDQAQRSDSVNKENETANLRQQKARDAAKAISASFETALGALDAASAALLKVGQKS